MSTHVDAVAKVYATSLLELSLKQGADAPAQMGGELDALRHDLGADAHRVLPLFAPSHSAARRGGQGRARRARPLAAEREMCDARSASKLGAAALGFLVRTRTKRVIDSILAAAERHCARVSSTSPQSVCGSCFAQLRAGGAWARSPRAVRG
jgi:hypothetical protein